MAVTLHDADQGDTTTLAETAVAAAEQVEAAHATTDAPGTLEEIVADKGYHSNATLVDLAAVGIRSYISEPDRGRRDWSHAPDAQAPVYRNRRRMRGARGGRLRRRRAELAERSFAHLYETGAMRRTHLRGHANILKRLLIHGSGFNLGLAMRHCLGIGTHRGAYRGGPGAPRGGRPLEGPHGRDRCHDVGTPTPPSEYRATVIRGTIRPI